MSLLIDYTKSLIPVNWKSSPSGWISGNCPMCVVNGEGRPDTKGRGGFHIDGDKLQYNCFNCGYKAGWSTGSKLTRNMKKLLMRLGADEASIQRIQLNLLQDSSISDLLPTKKKEAVKLEWPEMQLPPDTQVICKYDDIPPPKFLDICNYINGRGFNLDNSIFMYSPSTMPARMKNRFIIPFTYKGKIVGYTARWAGPPPKGIPKYYTQQPKRNFVFGLDQQTKNKQVVIVTEGQLDAIITDGVAIGSNNCNSEQADIIDSLNKSIIVVPDKDPASISLVSTAVDRGWKVSFPEWTDCKDVGDAVMKYGRLATIQSILTNAIDNRVKIQVMAKKYCR